MNGNLRLLKSYIMNLHNKVRLVSDTYDRIKLIKDTYKGETAYLITAGPSLTKLDREKLLKN